MTNDSDKLYHDLIQMIGELSTPIEAQRSLSNIRDVYGLRSVAYFGEHIKPRQNDEPYLAVTYSSEWIDHYIKNNYVLIDPVLKEGFSSVLPIDWRNFDLKTKRLKKFFGEATEFGLGHNGLTIPVRGRSGERALFTITSDLNNLTWERDVHLYKRDFQIIAYQVHAMILKAEGIGYETYTLARRERDCLQWASRGKTAAETSIILGIAERTVRWYLEMARHKLGASNISHAVAKAITAGIISTY